MSEKYKIKKTKNQKKYYYGCEAVLKDKPEEESRPYGLFI